MTTPRASSQRCPSLAVYWAYHIGTSGQATPQDVRKAYEAALAWLDRVARGKRALGERSPATSYPVENVDIDPYRIRTSRPNMKGSC